MDRIHQPQAQPTPDLRNLLVTMADALDHNPHQPATLPLTTDERVDIANDLSGADRGFLDLLPPDNTYLRKDRVNGTQRQCRACTIARARRQEEHRKAARNA